MWILLYCRLLVFCVSAAEIIDAELAADPAGWIWTPYHRGARARRWVEREPSVPDRDAEVRVTRGWRGGNRVWLVRGPRRAAR